MLGCLSSGHGEVREWLKRPVSKTGMPKGIGSSNLPLSAKDKGRPLSLAPFEVSSIESAYARPSGTRRWFRDP